MGYSLRLKNVNKIFILFIAVGCMTFGSVYSATISGQRIGSVDINRIIEVYPEAKKIKEDLSASLQTRKTNIENFQNQIDSVENEIENMEEQLKKYEKAKQEAMLIPVAAPVTAYSYGEPVKTSSGAVGNISLSSGAVALLGGAVGNISSSSGAVAMSGAAVGNSSSSNTAITASTGVLNMIPEISSPTFTADDIKLKKSNLEKQKKDLVKYLESTKQEEKAINSKIKKNLFGKIYDVIREVSDEEGLTVVIDSSLIIYGEEVQDITEKVIKKLK
ncbi:MAG: OmpH family outer membrane protein [Elusimicrobia bacterium]|nr:OmpH family outer membrane protein [Elusimicrobiota bacterium]